MELQNENGVLYRKWNPAGETKGVFLLVHGLGGHSARWSFWADFFKVRGYACYGIELKGFGVTTHPRGHIDSFQTYYHDILGLAEILRRSHPGKKILLTGESMGALICFMLAADHPAFFDGLICISPAFKNRLKFTFFERIRFLFSILFLPANRFKLRFDGKDCTRDPHYQAMMGSNPLESRQASAKLLWNILSTARIARKIKKFCVPVLFLLSGHDRLVDPSASKRVFDSLKMREKEIFDFAEMCHALSIDEDREKVFLKTLSWIERSF